MRTTIRLIVAIGTLALLPILCVADEQDEAERVLIPKQLPDNQRENLAAFLKAHREVKFFSRDDQSIQAKLPKYAIEKGVGKLIWSDELSRTVEQIPVGVVLYRRIDPDVPPEKAYVLWFRHDPSEKIPGVTVRRTVNLTDGKQEGPTEFRFNVPTPLAPLEERRAIERARQHSEALQAFSKKAGQSLRVITNPLLWQDTTGPHRPGDRIVRVRFTSSKFPEEYEAVVNLTTGRVEVQKRG